MRFIDDTEIWEEHLLGDICTFLKGNGISKSDLSDDGQSCILYGQLYTTYKNEIIKSVISKTKFKLTNPVLSVKNDVIIPGSGETPEDIATACCVLVDNVLYGGDLNIIRLYNHDGRFLSYQLNGKRKFDIAKVAQGKSIVHLHNDDLSKLKIYYPPNSNIANKIVSLLEKIDNRIESQSKIIEELKTYKNMIQHILFNQLIGSINEKLSSLCDIKTGKKDANAMTNDGTYKFFTCSKEDYLIDCYSFEGPSLLISGNGDVGLIKYYNGKFDAYQRTYVLQNFKINPIYLKFVLEVALPRKIMREKNVGAMPYIVLSTLSNLDIPIPDDTLIKNIVSLTNAIEKKITTEERIHNNYLKQKRFLLNNLFI